MLKEKINNVSFEEFKDITDSLWEESITDVEKRMYKRKRHCNQVARISMELIEYLLEKGLILIKKEKYAKQILYFSSLVHDIRIFEKDHHIRSAKYVCSELENDIKKDDLQNVDILIKAHNSEEDISFVKQTNEISEIEMKYLIVIIRLANKISKVNENEGKDNKTQLNKVIKASKNIIDELWSKEQFKMIKEYIIKNYS